MPPRIFIQIAAYRDPELEATLKDIIANADRPEDLRFGIAWQHSEDEKLPEVCADQRFRIIDIKWEQSKGVCWARNQVQTLYNGEEYTLQLDSHHRFIKSWDTEMIAMLKGLQEKGFEKPLITAYLPSYNPKTDPEGRTNVPWKMNFDRFIPEGVVFFMPGSIDNWQNLTEPVRARFYSAHFAFTLGQFCLEVPHDPQYYLHGYDLFHPHKLIAWHEYTRQGRTKHWDDHKSENKSRVIDGMDWGQRNAACHLRNRRFFGMDGEKHESINWGKYDFGTVRSFEDYQRYSGLDFSRRSIQEATRKNLPPPNPPVENWEASLVRVFKHCIDIHPDRMPHSDYEFWCVVFEEENGETIHRQDIGGPEANRMVKQAKDGKNNIQIWREFTCLTKPHHAVVWPNSKANGWGEKMIFPV
jgi:hypothetical protein